MNNGQRIWVCALLSFATACVSTASPTLTTAQLDSIRVVTPGQVSYVPLNPARGGNSPRAGVLWGDIRMNVASGVLLQFADGFSSPPHIHNITYRAVVISGEMHNDDPDAAYLWMGPGSFWTQPAGENHITAVRPGSAATAFLEIDSGPYLVRPPGEAFDNGERPLNLLSSNLVWQTRAEFTWLGRSSTPGDGPRVALLWGDLRVGTPSGSLLELPAGYTARLSSVDGELKVVVIRGEIAHKVSAATNRTLIGAGGFVESAGGVPHALGCRSVDKCLLYVRTDGSFALQ